MTRIIRITALLVFTVSLLYGEHADLARAAQSGNILHQVNHNAVLDGQVRVCDASANMADTLDEYGVLQWNEAIGANILTADCSLVGGVRGVTILDVAAGGTCGYSDPPQNTLPRPACADFPLSQDRVALGQYWTPIPLGYNPVERQTIVVHELGHNLGFDHYDVNRSIMNSNVAPNFFSPYDFIEPQAIDVTNYHTAYTPPAPVVSGSAGGSGQVQLNWTDVSWNEESFAVYRDNVWVATAPRNTTSLLLTNQPAGVHGYKMGGITRADCFGSGGFCAAGNTINVTVTVAGTIDYQAYDYSPKPSTSSGSLSYGEGTSTSFTVWVRNNGNSTAPASTVVMKFNNQTAPNAYGGVCNLPTISAGGTASCVSIAAVSWSFAGGPVTVHADYNNVVSNESSESNNVFAWGTAAVVPKASISLVNYPPFAAYGYTDQSSIETGFTVKMERRATSCSNGSWSTSSPGFSVTQTALSGNSSARQINFVYTHGYCYRLSVITKGTYANSSAQLSSTFNYP